MAIWFYAVLLLISVIEFLVFSSISIRTTSRYMYLLFGLVIICNLGYLSIGLSSNVEEVILANRFTYLGGVFLPFLMFMTISAMCDYEVPGFVRIILQILSGVVLVAIFTIGYNGLYYKSVSIGKAMGATYLIKEYGPLHNLYTILLLGEIIADFIVIFYSLKAKRKVSRRSTLMLAISLAVGCLFYFLERLFKTKIDVMPLVYVVFELVCLLIMFRMQLYDVSANVAEVYESLRQYAYITIDDKKNFMNCNDAATAVYPELSKVKVDSRQYPKDGDFYRDIIEWIDDRDPDDQNTSFKNIEKDGRFYRCNLREIKKGNKKLAGYIIELIDDTTQQEYIRLLNKYNSELKTEIVEKTEARDEADAANRAKSSFLANMSHEIRTPINSILGMNEMILRESDDPEILDYANSVQSASYTLLTLVNDILDFSKIEAGNMEIIPVEYNVSELVRYELSLLKNRAVERGLELKTSVSPDTPLRLMGDEVRIRQIATNLLTNAIKYTSKGSVFFNVSYKKTSEKMIDLIIEVRDTGQGIKKENLDKIFDSFSRVNVEYNRYIEGTGLGLAITSNFVKLMNGDMKVHSSYGLGSVFTVTIPQEVVSDETVGDFKESPDTEEKKQDAKGTGLLTKDARILAVDDNAMNLKVVVALLKNTGIDTICIKNGEEALQVLDKLPFDLVLMDHMMPGMDGIETMHAFKEKHPDDRTPFIALTANAITGSREQYINEGFDDYLPKPITGTELEQTLRKWLPREKVTG
ncbi:MAG: response regulator [Lachnospiraceae bacterium]|nr:response regulator [Lachnospiraceae bacterium]